MTRKSQRPGAQVSADDSSAGDAEAVDGPSDEPGGSSSVSALPPDLKTRTPEDTEVWGRFPVAEELPATVRSRTPHQATIGAATILLVEDEDALREAMARTLESGGYQIMQASGPSEAILESELYDGSIVLAIADVVMPYMSGIEMVHELRRNRPNLPALYMSGYALQVIAVHGELDAPLLLKPFDNSTLLQAVETAVHAPPPD